MHTEVFQGILIPFLGTTLGSACVLFMKNRLNQMVQRVLTGFAAGVMVAASIWSLLIPAMEQSEPMGKLSFLPAAAGRGLLGKSVATTKRYLNRLCKVGFLEQKGAGRSSYYERK